MKKILLALVLLVLCIGCASAENAALLGKPFPEFTATDTQGNVFTLSEVLKDHEAALINIWATWCPPCEREFPFLNEAYERYGDRVAFIALSCERSDTPKKIEAFRQAHGLTLPMGQDKAGLYQYIRPSGIPLTLIVDRFGNVGFLQEGSFMTAGEVSRVIEAFLGDGYTKTTVLTEIPKATATAAFPVSSARAIHVDNENARSVLFRAAGVPNPMQAYVIEGDVAHLRFEISAADSPADMYYYNLTQLYELPTLLDTARNAYVLDQPLPGADAATHVVYACLVNLEKDTSDDLEEVYLIPGEQYIEEVAQAMRSWGYDLTWEFGDAPRVQTAPKHYILHVVDQNGGPVAEAAVNFCTDTACVPLESDENGTITFTGAPDVYHVQLIDVPEGYSFDEDFELYTESTYGEWVLRVKKD
jgi:thiol-disulfide isomerase/thioredoxin